MKLTILALLCFWALAHACAADEPLIPAALNAVLPMIRSGMTISEVEGVLAPAYPTVKWHHGDGSGGSGYIEYRLDERHTLSVSSVKRAGDYVVHDTLLFYLYNWPAKRRLDLKIYEWEKQSGEDVSDR